MSNTHSKSIIMNMRASMNSKWYVSIIFMLSKHRRPPHTLVLFKECGLLHQFVYFKHANLLGTNQLMIN
jgi:hypothetical protein